MDLRTAHSLHQAGRLTEARTAYEAVLRVEPRNVDAWHLLGITCSQLGAPQDAVRCFENVVRIAPRHAEAHFNLGMLLAGQNRHEQAVHHFGQAVLLNPDEIDARNNFGCALAVLGRHAEAVPHFERVAAAQPDNAAALRNLGYALIEAQRPAEALPWFERIVLLEPASADVHYTLGMLLCQTGRDAQALPFFDRAIALAPGHFDAHFRRGTALATLGRHPEAAEQLRRALALKPDDVVTLRTIGDALANQSLLDEAMAHYRRALEIAPDSASTHSNLLFCLNYHPTLAGQAILAEYRRWNERHARPLARPVRHANSRDPGRRLRIGYVSPDLRSHASSYFIEPLLARHDRTGVEVFAYADVGSEDAVSERFKGYVDRWHNTAGSDEDALAGLIREDGIDILVDCAGFTAGNRLPVFARKAAPVQATWLGTGYTTGLEAIDYLFADHQTAPAGSDDLFAEKLARLPVWTAYRPPEGIGEPGPSPAEQGGKVTFGTLTRAVRLNDRVVRTWAAILRRLPGAQLVVNSGDFRDATMQRALHERFAAHGVEASRILAGYDSPPWNLLRSFDITLDCFPHNSGTTLFHSLYLGVPVVTLAARPSLGRVGSSVVAPLGETAWIAATEDEYVEAAVALAGDIPRLAALRATLRARMRGSLLMDERAFARSVESAYRAMWAAWCAGRPAQPLTVT